MINTDRQEKKSVDEPGKDVLAGIRIREGAELGDHNTLLRDGSHIRISSDKPTREKGCNRNDMS